MRGTGGGREKGWAVAALGIGAATALFALAALWLFPSRPTTSRSPSGVTSLRREALPIGRVRLDELPQMAVSPRLVDPAESLPRSGSYPYAELTRLYRYATTCRADERPHRMTAGLAKALLWHELVCGARARLPARFFEQPPFLHPSGASFAELARESGRKEFLSAEWLERHLGDFHLREAKHWPPLPGTALARSLASLDPGAAAALWRRAPLVLAGERVFVREDGPLETASAGIYALYPAEALFSIAKRAGFRARALEAHVVCPQAEGNVCWTDLPRTSTETRIALGLLSLGLLASLLGLLAQIASRRAQRLREAESRRFLLQTLTHELRTPAATLVLCVEGLRKEFDRLSPAGQTGFLRLCDEVQRLRRVVEASAHYLQVGGVLFRFVEVPSVNDLFRGLLAIYEGRVALVPLDEDLSFKVDRYWLSLCVGNLIDNALRHGRPPVRVSLSIEGEALRVSVSDAGEMTSARGRSSSGESGGLGLGLGIVRQVAGSMGGSLTFSARPTTFSLRLGEPS